MEKSIEQNASTRGWASPSVVIRGFDVAVNGISKNLLRVATFQAKACECAYIVSQHGYIDVWNLEIINSTAHVNSARGGALES